MLISVSRIRPVVSKELTSYSVVPDNHGIRRPLDSSLKILTQRDVVIQELQQIVALFLLEADYVSGELWIDIKRLLAGCGMSSHERVN